MSEGDAAQMERLRKINLIEVLGEDFEALGISLDQPDDLLDRSEAEIQEFFLSKQAVIPAPKFTQPSTENFKKWFPGLALSQTACLAPRWRVLCFPNAGNAEDLYTSEGTGRRRTASPLLDWCRAHAAECLAVQLPGRNLRRSERPLGSCREVAEALLPIAGPSLQDLPYFVIAHSVGCWNAFEFLQLAREVGLRLPTKVYFSAMAAPSIPRQSRPWREQHTLSEEQFKEECRGWDVNELVFSEAMWGTYQPLMRADFRLFDQYHFQHAGVEPFTFPMVAFWGTQDRRISESMVQKWQAFTSENLTVHKIEGNHLWPLTAAAKSQWLQMIAEDLRLIRGA